jgi:hypothetical protein
MENVDLVAQFFQRTKGCLIVKLYSKIPNSETRSGYIATERWHTLDSVSLLCANVCCVEIKLRIYSEYIVRCRE